MKLRSLAVAGAAAALLAPSAQAATTDTDSTVSGTTGSELSLELTTPPAMTFTPSTDGTSSSTATVTSTASTWTLSVFEKGTTDTLGTTVAGDGKLAHSSKGALANALDWKLSTATAWTALSGTAATVDSGALVDSRTIDYRQQINATEDITSGDAYSAILTYRVVG